MNLIELDGSQAYAVKFKDSYISYILVRPHKNKLNKNVERTNRIVLKFLQRIMHYTPVQHQKTV